MEKLSEVEYTTLADGLNLLARRGELPVDTYYELLLKLASRKDSAGKPEVLISNVTFLKCSDNAEIARGYALNHPRLGRTDVRTSLVMSKADDGKSFETLNTHYVIVPDPRDGSELAPASKREVLNENGE